MYTYQINNSFSLLCNKYTFIMIVILSIVFIKMILPARTYVDFPNLKRILKQY